MLCSPKQNPVPTPEVGTDDRISSGVPDFRQAVLNWFDRHGRKDLPWQTEKTPYAVWISEVMLQQTQVATVIPYYQHFMARFPTVAALAVASLDEVLAAWSGLGYYARARHLHAAAALLVTRHQGQIPPDMTALTGLPGIGRSTAGAILSLGYGQRAAILDGNVKRVLSRHFAVEGWPGQSRVSAELWRLSECLTPTQRVADYNQAMMDLGATCCLKTRPVCIGCPLSTTCQALASGRVAELPATRPRAALPCRRCYLLILTDRVGRIRLVQRPPAGLWGGLWAFPEFATEDALNDGCLKYGLDPRRLRVGPSGRHSFSHYHLDYTPVSLDAVDLQPQAVAETAAEAWFKPDALPAVPALVRVLLEPSHMTELWSKP